MKRLVIVGSSDLAKQITHFATASDYAVVGYLDDFKEKGISDAGNVIGKTAEAANLYHQEIFDEIIVGTGYHNMRFRKTIFERLKAAKIPFATIVHTSCVVDRTASIGAGSILYPGCIIDQHVKIKENVLLNLGCIVSHDSIIDDHCFLSPAVTIAGFCSVGKECNLGINTSVIDNISICDSVQTGGAAVVVKNVVKPGLYVGIPARFVKQSG